MDSLKYRYPFAACGILTLLLNCGAVSLLAEIRIDRPSDPYAAWDETLTQEAANPFPQLIPFDAEYCFGWEGLSAGSARVSIQEKPSGRLAITAEGGPDKWIRTLWNYQAIYYGEAGVDGRVPSWFHMDEHISKGSLFSDAYFGSGSVFACHRLLMEKKPWELTELPGVRDLFAAMLFVRSQPLHDGEKLRLTVFPDQSPYLVDLTVAGRDTLMILGKKIRAIRFVIRIQTIETHGGNKGRLAPHRKFRSGRVWMSDDERRVPLRAEVDVFIGRVFAEAVKFQAQ